MQKVELTRLDRRKVKILEKRAAFLKKKDRFLSEQGFILRQS